MVSRRFWGCLILTLSVAVVAAYGASLRNSFVAWDDLNLVVDNPIVQRISPSTIARAFASYDPELYIPLTLLSYQIDDAAGGGGPFAFHLTSLLLHVLNAALVAWFLWSLTRRRWLAAAASVLFLLHPLNVEAVAWISGRKDLLSATFFLGSCVAYLSYARKGRARPYLLSLAAFLLALLAKASVVTLPLLLFLLDAWLKRPMNAKLVREKIPFFLLAIVFTGIALVGKERTVEAASAWTTLLLIPRATIFLLTKILLPFKLSVLYPYTDPVALTTPGIAFSILALALLLGAAWRLRSKVPALWWGLAWFLVALAPNVLNFHKGEDLGDLYLTADRYGYLPSIGVYVTLGTLFVLLLRRQSDWPERQRKAFALLSTGLVAFVFLWRSHVQAGMWRDTETLFRQTLRTYPNAHTAHIIIGGHYVELGNLEAAVEEYLTALSIRPTARAYYNLGVALMKAGEFEQAIRANEEALKLDPTASLAQMNIGVVHVKRKEYAEALAAFRKTVEIDPGAAAAYVNIGIVSEQLGRTDDARRAYEKALAIQPDLAIAREKLDALQ